MLNKKIMITILLVTMFVLCSSEVDETFLPKEHLQYFYKTEGKCWGYEPWCETENEFSAEIECDSDIDPHNRERKSRDVFFDEADFGYVRQRLRTMMSICEPRNSKGEVRLGLRSGKVK
jgi:hypothetical protein